MSPEVFVFILHLEWEQGKQKSRLTCSAGRRPGQQFCVSSPNDFIILTSGGTFLSEWGWRVAGPGVENEGQIHIKARRSAFLLRCCRRSEHQKDSEQRAL